LFFICTPVVFPPLLLLAFILSETLFLRIYIIAARYYRYFTLHEIHFTPHSGELSSYRSYFRVTGTPLQKISVPEISCFTLNVRKNGTYCTFSKGCSRGALAVFGGLP
jgi:hypothetical protein